MGWPHLPHEGKQCLYREYVVLLTQQQESMLLVKAQPCWPPGEGNSRQAFWVAAGWVVFSFSKVQLLKLGQVTNVECPLPPV